MTIIMMMTFTISIIFTNICSVDFFQIEWWNLSARMMFHLLQPWNNPLQLHELLWKSQISCYICGSENLGELWSNKYQARLTISPNSSCSDYLTIDTAFPWMTATYCTHLSLCLYCKWNYLSFLNMDKMKYDILILLMLLFSSQQMFPPKVILLNCWVFGLNCFSHKKNNNCVRVCSSKEFIDGVKNNTHFYLLPK